jgi:hypothetical protein
MERKRAPHRSRLQVLQSAAGYYIGTTWIESEDDIQPYSRDSQYFETKEAAERALVDNDYIQNFY